MKNTMKKMLAVVLVLVMCVSVAMPVFAAEAAPKCPGAKLTDPTKAEHMKSNCDYEFIAKHEKSCEKQGYTVYQCKGCGVYFADDIVPSNGGVCTWVIDKAATCTEAGEKHCSVCGAKEVIEKVAHKYVWDTNATCGLIGAKRVGTCSVCGHVTTEDLSEHKWNEIPDIIKKPVCAPVEDAAGHSNTKKDKSEYCGLARYTCSVCKGTKDVVIYALDHHDIVDVELKAATCTEAGVKMADGYTATTKDGKQYGQKCELCGWTNTVVETASHTFGVEPDRSMEATCTEWGFDLWGCTVCGENKTVAYPPLGHYLVKVSGADATCGTAVTQVWECQWDKCNETGCDHKDHPTTDTCNYTETRDLKALEHEYKTVVTEATCNAPKKTEEICKNCGDVKSSVVEGDVDEDAHKWVRDYENSTEPTCTLAGAWLDHCTVCNAYKTEPRPATGHNYDVNKDKVVTSADATVKAPWCDANGQHDGILTYVCQNGCGHTYTEEGAKFDQTNPAHHGGVVGNNNVHKFTKAEAEARNIPYRDATCTLTDIKSYRCDICTALNANKEVTFVVIGPALGHVDAAGNPFNITTLYPTQCGQTTTTPAFDCDRCDFAVAAKTYKTSVTTHKEVIISENKVLSCGNPVKYGCECKFDVLDETGKVVAKDVSCAYTRTATQNHKMAVEKNSRDNDCDLFGFRYNYCTLCEAGYIDMYEYATGHNLVEDKGTDGKGYYTEPTCVTPGLKVENCTNVHTNRVTNTNTVKCDEVVKTDIKRLGHLDAEGNVIECTDAEGKPIIEDVLCYRKEADGGCCNCAATVEKCPGHEVKWETLHEWVNTTVAATCVHYEYTLHVCTVCQYDYTTTGFDLGDHDYTGAYKTDSKGNIVKDEKGNPIPDVTKAGWYAVKGKAATYTQAGTKAFDCKNGCGAKLEAPYTLTDIKFTLKTDSGIKAGADIVNSGKMIVVIEASAYDIDLYSIDLQVKYDTSKYVYKGFKVSDYTKALIGESGVEVGNATAGLVGIYMANNGKTPTNVSLDKIANKALITLEFDVKADACVATTGTTTGRVWIDTASVLKADKDTKVDRNIADASKTVTIQTLGNVTKGTIESSKKLVDDYDGRALVKVMMTANAYEATADINKDGKVNGADYAALAKYIADGCTYAQLCATK
jgi:hypothetical protein